MPSQLESAIATYRARLLSGDARALSMMTQAYAPVRERLVALIGELVADLEAGTITAANVAKLRRVDVLVRQIEDELVRLTPQLDRFLTVAQRAAVQLALEQAQGLVVAQQASLATSWARINTGAVQSVVGALGDGSPLRAWLNRWGTETADAIERALVDAVTTGQHPADVARMLTKQIDASGMRLLTLTRTEILRAYRTATSENMKANRDVLSGWYWISALQPRSCGACIAKHMTFHPVDEPMRAHPACRCTQAPAVRGVPFNLPTGEEWFAKQSARVQDQVLGSRVAGEAYRNGKVELDEFVVRRRDPVWGDSYQLGSLAQARAGRERRAA